MEQQGDNTQQGNNTQQGRNTQEMGMPYSMNPYQPNPRTGHARTAPGGSIQAPQPTILSASSSSTHIPRQHQLAAYQHMHQQQQQQLQQQLQAFWARQCQEVERTTDFKSHNLPLARIKKIMKADEDVHMVSSEAPVIFAKACEMFIQELTLRAWNHTEQNKRRTLQKSDVAAAIASTENFDFLVDVVPGEDQKDEVLAAMPGAGGGLLPSVGQPNEGLPYYYMQPPPPPQIGGPPGMFLGKPVDPTAYGQQALPPPPQIGGPTGMCLGMPNYPTAYGQQAPLPFMPPPPQVWPQQLPPPPPPTGPPSPTEPTPPTGGA